MKYLLSVIIPIYNTAKYLDRCINSIVSQTYTNIEIICINDGSTDNCKDILDRWQTKDTRIKVYHKENGGIASARNLGLEKASGDYIGWVDSDDYVDKDYFKRLMIAIIKSKSDIVIGSSRKETSSSKILKSDRILKEFLINKLTCAVWETVGSARIYNGEQFENYGIGEDTLLLCHLLEKSKRVIIMPSLGYHYEIRNDSAVHAISINKYNDWIDVYLSIYEFLISKNKEYKGYCSYRLIIEMMSILYQIENADINIKKALLKRMRKVYLFALFRVRYRELSLSQIANIIAIGKCLLVGRTGWKK